MATDTWTSSTIPVLSATDATAPAIMVAATYKDPVSGALYVHRDLEAASDPWADEAHIKPVKAAESFGDVESWAKYVQRFADESGALLTWNSRGLKAVIDYHGDDGSPRRCQWTAFHPFEPSLQWKAWTALANGQPISQRQAVERLEDLGADIVDPPQVDLLNLLRSLRASVNAKADTELRPDGTTSVTFSKDAAVRSNAAEGSLTLPSEIGIAIPVLKGHLDAEGRPVIYRVQVRLRVSVTDDAHLALRFTMPLAERVLEDVYADRVKSAQALLGEPFPLLRAAD